MQSDDSDQSFTAANILSRLGAMAVSGGLHIVLLACLIGAFAGVAVTILSNFSVLLHRFLFSLPIDVRLSGLLELSNPVDALVPVAGGVLIGMSIWLLRRYRNRSLVDPIEANALYGGRLSIADTLIVVGQTVLSNGFGASVGLEAAYTQTGAGFASSLARTFNLRRNDVRTLVGCGAAAAIAAAFGAPLTGAFYGFELIIGVYSLANVAPVIAAAVSGSLMATQLGAEQFPIEIGFVPPLTPEQYLPFILLGVVAGLTSVAIMQLVTLIERTFIWIKIRATFRPVLGGLAVGGLALMTPHVLSSGHGAMHLFLINHFTLGTVALVFALKMFASAISLGSGFRGGLFFASLFLGVLLGNMFATVFSTIAPGVPLQTTTAAVVGMTSLAVGIVGGPLTMTFLALESTRDLAITSIVLAAAIASSMVVKSIFGYSFSTWRFHLRGETIRGANDIGWMRNLTVKSMMRTDIRTVPVSTSLEEFRKLFRLGAAQRVIAIDGNGDYAGMIFVPDAHTTSADEGNPTIATLLRTRNTVLIPLMNAKAAAAIFDKEKAEELAVVEGLKSRKVVGLLTEAHLIRRYSEELEKAHRDLSGND
jgi:CIC family chloride channel protein